MPGERDEMRYLAARRRRRDSAMELRPRDPRRHDRRGARHRQHRHHQAVERDAHRRRSFAELLLEAGFPPESFCYLPGSGAAIGDLLVQHPKTRFISFTGSRDVGLRINELAAKHQPGQIWIKRVVAEMGGKDAIVVDGECDLDKAVEGVLFSAFGYQGQKCSACSRAIVDQRVYDEFLDKLKARAENLAVGPTDDPRFYMGPVISAGRAQEHSGVHRSGQRGRTRHPRRFPIRR